MEKMKHPSRGREPDAHVTKRIEGAQSCCVDVGGLHQSWFSYRNKNPSRKVAVPCILVASMLHKVMTGNRRVNTEGV